jgi:hydroxypyruvate reductase
MDLKAALQKTIISARGNYTPYKLLHEHLSHLPMNRPIYIFALGKAACQMTEAVLLYARQEQFIRIMGGLVITRYGNVQKPLERMTIIESGHPLPDENSFRAGEEAIRFLQKLKEDDILLVLLSGGGSALMEKPAEGYSREDIISRTSELLKDGSGIETINTERKKMSALKGGKLYNHIRSKVVFIYAMSDVPGDKPRYIASNPFLPDAEKSDDKLSPDTFHRYDGFSSSRLGRKDKAVVYQIAGNNNGFCEQLKVAALEFLPGLQFDKVHIISTDLAGEAATTGKEIADLAKLINKQRNKGFTAFKTPCLLIFGGETYVNVKGGGKGGRCTELALAAVEELAQVPNSALIAFATDGQDGFCDASGAVIDSQTYEQMKQKGIDIGDSLEENDSYTALKAVDAILPAEVTGMNVNDVVMLYIG